MRRAQLALASLVIARNSRKSPLEGIKSLATLETEASRMVTSYGHTQQLGGSLNPEVLSKKQWLRFQNLGQCLVRFTRCLWVVTRV